MEQGKKQDKQEAPSCCKGYKTILWPLVVMVKNIPKHTNEYSPPCCKIWISTSVLGQWYRLHRQCVSLNLSDKGYLFGYKNKHFPNSRLPTEFNTTVATFQLRSQTEQRSAVLPPKKNKKIFFFWKPAEVCFNEDSKGGSDWGQQKGEMGLGGLKGFSSWHGFQKLERTKNERSRGRWNVVRVQQRRRDEAGEAGDEVVQHN